MDVSRRRLPGSCAGRGRRTRPGRGHTWHAVGPPSESMRGDRVEVVSDSCGSRRPDRHRVAATQDDRSRRCGQAPGRRVRVYRVPPRTPRRGNSPTSEPPAGPRRSTRCHGSGPSGCGHHPAGRVGSPSHADGPPGLEPLGGAPRAGARPSGAGAATRPRPRPGGAGPARSPSGGRRSRPGRSRSGRGDACGLRPICGDPRHR